MAMRVMRKAVQRSITPLTGAFRSVASLANIAGSNEFVRSLVDSRIPFHSMPAAFYNTELVHSFDLKHIWGKTWIQCGFAFQIPKPGDYFTYQIGDDSMILIRGDDHRVRCFFNTCRHRGSIIVNNTPNEEAQNTKRLICKYHQWSYGRDGRLLWARDMGPAFDPTQFGLFEAHCEVVEGIIFICKTKIHEKPMFDFAPCRKAMESQLKPHRLGDMAKLAYTEFFVCKANWKLVYENNRECFHCNGGHPEYILSNEDIHFSYVDDGKGNVTRDIDPTHPRKRDTLEAIQNLTNEWAALGFTCSPDADFPGDGYYRASRMPLKVGWLSEHQEKGKYYCEKIMGDLPHRNMGSMRIHTLPNWWIHASHDHAVSARLTPLGPEETLMRIDWLVHKDAKEGEDYKLEELLHFWQITNKQDKTLAERNHRGVVNSGYQPGPLSFRKESGLERFIQWYLRTLKRGVTGEVPSGPMVITQEIADIAAKGCAHCHP